MWKCFEAKLKKSLKTLKEEEVKETLLFLQGLPSEKAEKIMQIGEEYCKASTLNGTWFWRQAPVLASRLQEKEYELWLTQGQAICQGNWEVAMAFLKSSLEAASLRELFPMWINLGRELSRYHSAEAAWFFSNSVPVLVEFPKKERLVLARWLQKLVNVSWGSVNACLRIWRQLAKETSLLQRDKLLHLAYKLAEGSGEAVQQYLLSLPDYIREIGIDSVTIWIEGAYMIGPGELAAVTAYFKSSPRLAERMPRKAVPESLTQWTRLGKGLAEIDTVLAQAFFNCTDQVLLGLQWTQIEQWTDLIVSVSHGESVQAAKDFICATPELVRYLKIKELETWVTYGLKKTTGGNRKAYFKLKSQESRDIVTSLRSGLFFESVKKLLSFYYEGITGDDLRLRNINDLPESIRGSNQLNTTVDTRRVYLPEVVRVFENDQDNNRVYKAMLMHQAAHLEFGTLDLGVVQLKLLSQEPVLATIFELLEDARVDYLASKKYAGTGADFDFVIRALHEGDRDIVDLVDYLRFFPKTQGRFPAGNPSEVAKCLLVYWEKIYQSGGSVNDTLSAAQAITEFYAKKDISLQLEGKNLVYRGKLNFHLLSVSKLLDIELSQAEQAPKDFLGIPAEQGSFVARQEFLRKLKVLLEKFLEEEENPYRLIRFYDEWDRTINDYKKDWCTVREKLLKPSSARFVEQALRENYGMIVTLKQYFGMLRPDRLRRYRRQEDGEEVDIDSIIEAQVEIKAGISPNGGFYIRRDKRDRDVAVAFLLDMSYSTEEKIAKTNKSLLDVEKEAVVVMAEALEILGDRYAIYGFNSDGRDKVSFYVVKDFDELYSSEVKQRFGGLQSYGMTRLASAVRHAVYKLESVKAAVRILILLSDGRPFDFDYNSGLNEDYQAFYPESDSRMALQETKMKGINPFCITVDQKGYEYLEYIYGPVNFIVINQVEELPTKLIETYRNLTT